MRYDSINKLIVLFYYWVSKLISLLIFPHFPNSHHLRTNFPNDKGPRPQIQMSWKITALIRPLFLLHHFNCHVELKDGHTVLATIVHV
jgi:hypothetical protein